MMRSRFQLDLFKPPEIEQAAPLPADAVFMYGGRPLRIVKSYGTDEAAPVIVEELSDRYTLKGQYGLWSAGGVRRHMGRVKPETPCRWRPRR
jgi:hypothetical protein